MYLRASNSTDGVKRANDEGPLRIEALGRATQAPLLFHPPSDAASEQIKEGHEGKGCHGTTCSNHKLV